VEVQQARETVAKLEGNLAQAHARATELQTERRKLAFDANTGDAGAKKELDKLNAQSTTIAFEIENLRSAIDEARVRVTDAERAADAATQRARAKQVKEVAGRIDNRGPTLAAAVTALCNEYTGLIEDLDEIRMLRAPVVQQRLVELAFSKTVGHALQQIGLEIGDHVPPALRHSPEHLASQYARGASAWADSVLGDTKTGEAA
jgi:predicted  nucleic acid-binding Zn-ribbon protein